MEFLIVTGLSGGGKSQASHFLEDMDYYCVDNMPAELLIPFAEFCLASNGRFNKVALVTDVRAQESFETLFNAIDKLQIMDCSCRILFLEAPINVIVRRYKESRRPHPLNEPGWTMDDLVRKEIRLMQPVRDRADYIVDTGNMTLGQLHKELRRIFAEDGRQTLPVCVLAFGYKYGIPAEADLVFDVRFLPNPYYVEELRSLTGFDAPVYDYVMNQPDTEEFCAMLYNLVDYLLPKYQEEGKQSLTVAVGCTGGKHRSIALSRALTEHLLGRGQNARMIARDAAKTNE